MEKAHMDRRTKYSLRAIQNALLDILEKKDFGSISVTEVCEKADVNRGTFYKYHRDIDDLYDTIEDKFVDDLRALLQTTDGKGDHDFFYKVTAMLQTNRAFVKPRYHGQGSARLLNKLLGMVLPGTLEQILSRRPDLDQEEARYLNEFIIGGCARIYEVWINEGMILPAGKMQQYISRFVNASLGIQ